MKRKIVDITQFKKVMVVYNPKSGARLLSVRSTIVGAMVSSFHKAVGKVEFIEERLERFEQLHEIADKIVREQVEWVVVAAGDGTLRALVELLVEDDYRPYISIFPAGTVNLVAKELEQVLDADRWVKRISRGVVTPVWLGKANDRIFLTVAGIGVDSLVVDNVSEKAKKYLSKFAYVQQGGNLVRQEILLRNWQYKFQVMIDNDGLWRDASSVLVAKSRYYAGRFSLVDGSSLSSPKLHVCLFTGHKRIDFLRYVALIMTDMLQLDKTVEIIQAQHVRIKSNVQNFAAELDGDSLVTSPLEIGLLAIPMEFIS